MIRKSVKRFSEKIMRKQEAKAGRALAGNVTELDESRAGLKNPLAIMWMERFVVMQRTSSEMTRGKFQGVSQLDGDGMLMPVFSFEKISPPAPQAPASPTPKKANEKTNKKPRGVIVQMLDRIARARARRSPQKD